MKPLILIAALCAGPMVHAQTDGPDTIKYVHGLPVTGKDTIPENDNELQEEHLVRVSKQKIPKQLISTLRDDELYNGWEHNPVYRNVKSGLYLVTVLENDTIKRIYGFNENGRPVTFDESTIRKNE